MSCNIYFGTDQYLCDGECRNLEGIQKCFLGKKVKFSTNIWDRETHKEEWRIQRICVIFFFFFDTRRKREVFWWKYKNPPFLPLGMNIDWSLNYTINLNLTVKIYLLKNKFNKKKKKKKKTLDVLGMFCNITSSEVWEATGKKQGKTLWNQVKCQKKKKKKKAKNKRKSCNFGTRKLSKTKKSAEKRNSCTPGILSFAGRMIFANHHTKRGHLFDYMGVQSVILGVVVQTATSVCNVWFHKLRYKFKAYKTIVQRIHWNPYFDLQTQVPPSYNGHIYTFSCISGINNT